jgi:hypothetical protein
MGVVSRDCVRIAFTLRLETAGSAADTWSRQLIANQTPGSLPGSVPPTKKENQPMFRYTLTYARYVLTALSTIGFKLAAN